MTESARPAARASLGRSVEHIESPLGSVDLVHHAHGIVGSKMRGHLDEVLTRATLSFIDRVIERDGPLAMFHDWDEMTGYDGEARALCTAYVLERYRNVRGVHALVRSPIVAMGISTANLITKTVGVTLVSHRERSAFESARAEAISPTSAPSGAQRRPT